MPTVTPTSQLLKIHEAAQRLRCSRWTVYRKVNSGELRALRAGAGTGPLLFRTTDIDRLLQPARPQED